MISIAEANRISLSHTCPAAAVRLPLAELQGRILAEDVVAVEAVPAVPTSIMDGYAVVSADGAGEFPVAGDGSRAGGRRTGAVSPGSVCYITTGAPVPDGADAVVMIEVPPHPPPSARGARRAAWRERS